MNEQQILIRNLVSSDESQSGSLIHNLRFIRIAKMLSKRLPEESTFSLSQLIDIVLSDPTTHLKDEQLRPGKYSEWLVKQYLSAESKSVFFEDLEKVSGDLSKFHELKTRNKIPEKNRDINKINTSQDLFEIVSSDEDKIVLLGFPDFRHLTKEMDAVLLYANRDVNLYVLLSHKAAKDIGSNTRWCTTASASTFDYYSKKSFLYVLFVKTKAGVNKYQFHFQTSQFMNELDQPISLSKFIHGNQRIALVNFAEKEFDPFVLLHFEEFDKIHSKHFQHLLLHADSCYGVLNVRFNNFLSSSRGWNLLSNTSESTIIKVLKNNPRIIRRIPNPTQKMKIAAVIADISLAIDFPELLQDEKILDELIHGNSRILSYVNHFPHRIQMLAAQFDAIDLVPNPCAEARMESLRRNKEALGKLKNPTKEEIDFALAKRIDNIKYVPNPTEKMQLDAVKKNPYLISSINNPCHRAQIAVITYDPSFILRIKNPTPEARKYAQTLTERKKKELSKPNPSNKERWSQLPIDERVQRRMDQMRREMGRPR